MNINLIGKGDIKKVLTLVLMFLLFIVYVIYNLDANQKKMNKEFQDLSVESTVKKVYYENKLNRIDCVDGTKLAFHINYDKSNPTRVHL